MSAVGIPGLQAGEDVKLHHRRRIRDLRYKGTRQVVDCCIARGIEAIFVGNPDGVRRWDSGRHHNQRMSPWEYGKDIQYLEQKSEKARIRTQSHPSGGGRG